MENLAVTSLVTSPPQSGKNSAESLLPNGGRGVDVSADTSNSATEPRHFSRALDEVSQENISHEHKQSGQRKPTSDSNNISEKTDNTPAQANQQEKSVAEADIVEGTLPEESDEVPVSNTELLNLLLNSADSPQEAFQELIRQLQLRGQEGEIIAAEDATANLLGIQSTSVQVTQQIIHFELRIVNQNVDQQGLDFVRGQLAGMRQIMQMITASMQTTDSFKLGGMMANLSEGISFASEMSQFAQNMARLAGATGEAVVPAMAQLHTDCCDPNVQRFLRATFTRTEITQMQFSSNQLGTQSDGFFNVGGAQGAGTEKFAGLIQQAAALTGNDNNGGVEHFSLSQLNATFARMSTTVTTSVLSTATEGSGTESMNMQQILASFQSGAGTDNFSAAKGGSALSGIMATLAAMAQQNGDGAMSSGEGDASASDMGDDLLNLLSTTARINSGESDAFLKLIEQPQTPATPRSAPSEQMMAQVKMAVKNGDSSIKMHLHPAELGVLEIRMDINRDGMTKLHVTADNTRTLELLRNDVRAMERMLTDIGLKADAGSLSFNLRGEQQPGQGNNAQSDNPPSNAPGKKTPDALEEALNQAPLRQLSLEADGLDIRI